MANELYWWVDDGTSRGEFTSRPESVEGRVYECKLVKAEVVNDFRWLHRDRLLSESRPPCRQCGTCLSWVDEDWQCLACTPPPPPPGCVYKFCDIHDREVPTVHYDLVPAQNFASRNALNVVRHTYQFTGRTYARPEGWADAVPDEFVALVRQVILGNTRLAKAKHDASQAGKDCAAIMKQLGDYGSHLPVVCDGFLVDPEEVRPVTVLGVPGRVVGSEVIKAVADLARTAVRVKALAKEMNQAVSDAAQSYAEAAKRLDDYTRREQYAGQKHPFPVYCDGFFVDLDGISRKVEVREVTCF